jgi:hypothetical protein
LTGQSPVQTLAEPSEIASRTVESMVDPRFSAAC